MRFLLLLFGLFATRLGLGQTASNAPPPGGYALRQVPAIRPTTQADHRLVSYRKGNLYGYSDTTGTLVVAPAATARLPFFKDGLGRTYAGVLPALAGLPSSEELVNEVLFNALGEYLLVRYNEYAAPGPDGQWRAHPLPAARRPELAPAVSRWDHAFLEPDEAARKVRQRLENPPKGSSKVVLQELGPNLATFNLVYKKVEASYSKAAAVHYARRGRCGVGPWPLYLKSELGLVTTSGQHLTKLQYSDLSHYSERRLWYATKGHYSVPATYVDADSLPHGVLDAQGHRLTGARFDGFSPFCHGVATVRLRRGAHRWLAGVIDSLGHYTMRPQPEPLSRTDEAGLVRRLHQGPGGQPVVQFLNRFGQPAFPQYEVADAGPMWGGRAWARVGEQQGLLDAAGRWVVPCQYTKLLYPYYQAATLPDKRRDGNDFEATIPGFLLGDTGYNVRYYYPRPDSAFLVCQRAGRYGLVSRHTGQEVVPCRYDSVLAVANGYGSFRREGRIYFVSPQGQELAQGCFEGETYDFPQGRFFKLYSDYIDYRIGSPHNGQRSWTVVSPQGRQMLPWQATPGDYLPEGGALLAGGTPTCGCAAPCATVVAADGRVLYQAPGTLGYGVAAYGDHHMFGKAYYSTVAPDSLPPLHLFQHQEGRRAELLDSLFRPVTAWYTYLYLTTPNSSWCTESQFVFNEAGYGQLHTSTLLALGGRRYTLPVGLHWSYNAFGRQASPFNSVGVILATGSLLTQGGYVTLGGRYLWED